MKRFMNKKGVIDPVSLFFVTAAIYATVCVGATYALGGQDLAKKNGQSIWAHMQGLCTGDTPDARCINK